MRPKAPGGTKGSIKLLKPHGSLNWEASNGGMRLLRNPYLSTSAEGKIIPPTYFKRLNEDPYASVWKTART